MKNTIQSNKSITSLKYSPNQSLGWRSLLLIPCIFMLACFSLPQAVRAVTPAPDGGYPNGNTAEGTNALFDLDVNNSSDNTALGNEAMDLSDVVQGNTAVGSFAMEF